MQAHAVACSLEASHIRVVGWGRLAVCIGNLLDCCPVMSNFLTPAHANAVLKTSGFHGNQMDVGMVQAHKVHKQCREYHNKLG